MKDMANQYWRGRPGLAQALLIGTLGGGLAHGQASIDEESLNAGGEAQSSAAFSITGNSLGQSIANPDNLPESSTAGFSLKGGYVYALEPYEIGTLTLVKDTPGGTTAIISWPVEGVFGSDYHGYRGCIANLNGTDYGVKMVEVYTSDCPPAPVCPPDPAYCCCTPQPCAVDADDPPAATQGYFYLVTGRSDAGRDGILGFDSTPAARPKAGTACP